MSKITKEQLPANYDWVNLDGDFGELLGEVLDTQKNLFFCGPAGTGKSLLIELANKMLKGKVLTMASTGISSSNISDKGVACSTIHSTLKIPVLQWYSKDVPISQEAVESLSDFDTIIIDEISMVSSNLFDQINRILKKAEMIKKSKIRILLFGDVLQLSPVVPFNNKELLAYYKSKYDNKIFFFNSDSFISREIEVISLDNIYRQESVSFQDILNKIRLGLQTKKDLQLINEKKTDLENFLINHKYKMILATTRARVNELNQKYGIPDGKNHKTYYGVKTGNFRMADFPYCENEDYSVTIYETQQVMCIKNSIQGGYQNGTLGTVVSLNDDSIIIEKQDGHEVEVKIETWKQSELAMSKNGEGYLNEKGTYSQIGCVPALALTFHKSQSLTLDAVYLDLNSRWVPDSGIYLALSRCKSLEGIGLSRNIVNRDIKLNNEAYDYIYELMMEE